MLCPGTVGRANGDVELTEGGVIRPISPWAL